MQDEVQAGRALGSVLAVSGAVVTGHLLDPAFTGRDPVMIGELVSIPAGAGRVFGIVHRIRRGRRIDDKPSVEVHLLGEMTDAGFRRGVSCYPPLDVLISRATQADIATVYAAPKVPHAPVGHLRQEPAIGAHVLIDGLLGQHFAVLGSTGSGKSCAVTVVLSAVLDRCPFAHVLLLDPHAEYGAAFGDRALCLDQSSLELPYWLLTFEEIAAILTSGQGDRAYAEGAILRDGILRAKQIYAGDADGSCRITVDTPIPYRLSDLAAAIEDAMGTLAKAEGVAAYRHLLARLAGVREDPRYRFLFQSLLVRDSMQAVLAHLLRLPTAGRPITVVDLSGVPSEIVNVVVSLLCRLIFDFGLWSDRERSPPLLLVCEEAHRYVPGDGLPVFEPSRRAIDRIAKEGRKYGVSLCLVSQRPAELSASALSQCGTIFALRMSNERDQAFVRNALPDGSDWLIRTLPALGTGEAVAVGEGVLVPMQLRFSELPPDARPASRTPSFADRWARDVEDDLLPATIARWRAQRR
ncbi:MAG: DUF87 domain-containing protein [Geminicoccaceae bacterium]